MANSCIPGPLISQLWICRVPARTPGPLGFHDQADPNITSLLGDTPGPLGINDYADPTLPRLESAWRAPACMAPPVCSMEGVPLSRGSAPDQPLNDKVLVFPDTTYRYQRTTRPLSDCLGTLPADLRADFKTEIETVITKMHELGFALGVNPKVNAGYRTFQVQYDLPAGSTRAGPGESFHNYLCAVDLGFLQWVDEDGKPHADYWLGAMAKDARYKGFPDILWEKRDSLSTKVHRLSFERIHLQAVPENTSGRAMLVRCLNQAARNANDQNWNYRTAGKEYQCTLGASGANPWKGVGSAKNMWDSTSPLCTAAQKAILRRHMELAETIARTISLD